MAIEIASRGTKIVNDALRSFVRDVMKKAGLQNKDGSCDEEYVDRLREQLEKRIGLMVMRDLSAENLDLYTKLLYGKEVEPQEIAIFLQEKIVDFSTKQQKVFDDFSERIIASSAAMRKAME
jgi:hypothetical protein